MALRCLLFSSDEEAAHIVGQALPDLGIEEEYCSVAVEAIEKVTSQSFQLVIVDWDNQPEAGLLLQAARERKAAERPLTLAIVKDDGSVPQALQAGANSILRKPMRLVQVRETLTVARNLLRAKREPAAPLAKAAAAGASAAPAARGAVVSVDPVHADPVHADNVNTDTDPANNKTLRAGEFLQSSAPAPGAQFITEADAHHSLESKAVEVDPLEDLAPMAAAVETQEKTPDAPAPRSTEPRGLSWYLNARAGTLPPVPVPPPVSVPTPAKPELIGFDQTPSNNGTVSETAPPSTAGGIGLTEPGEPVREREKKTEAALFAYIDGESAAHHEEAIARPRPWLGKVVLVGALALTCGVASVIVPRPLWSQNLRLLVGYVVHTGQGWLNPPTVAPPQAPATHENFGRAGDEYKLPVAENIPDATTDPSQIRVLPVIDPTAKPPNGAAANGNQAPTEGSPDPAANGSVQTNPTQVQDSQTSQPVPPMTAPATNSPVNAAAQPPPGSALQPSHPDPFTAPPAAAVSTSTASAAPASQPVPLKLVQPNHATVTNPGGIPSSLKSQMASMTPDASGNKPPEAAMPSIEPVDLPEATVRALLLEQPELAYPPSAKGQPGKVVLAVLIGRDGTVQDAKFLQGSLAFARAAIDGVKQWHFKPYTMNGRPVSTQTLLTINFKPAP